MTWLRKFLHDESAQDLVEYAYLSLFIGIAGLIAWTAIVNTMGAAYQGYDTNVQNAWEPCDPGVAPPCP
jgi:Flp pilus assembly pilin Flp